MYKASTRRCACGRTHTPLSRAAAAREGKQVFYSQLRHGQEGGGVQVVVWPNYSWWLCPHGEGYFRPSGRQDLPLGQKTSKSAHPRRNHRSIGTSARGVLDWRLKHGMPDRCTDGGTCCERCADSAWAESEVGGRKPMWLPCTPSQGAPSGHDDASGRAGHTCGGNPGGLKCGMGQLQRMVG